MVVSAGQVVRKVGGLGVGRSRVWTAGDRVND